MGSGGSDKKPAPTVAAATVITQNTSTPVTKTENAEVNSAATITASDESTKAIVVAQPRKNDENLPPPIPSVAPTVVPNPQKCGTDAEKTKVVELDFPPLTTECKWGLEGNGAKSASVTAATATQSVDINAPEGSVLCGVNLETVTQTIQYDDFIFFTLNDFLLASGQWTEENFLDMGMEKSGDLVRYEKAKHIGKGPYQGSMNSVTSAYCPPTGSCFIGVSQSPNSPLRISVPPSWFALLPQSQRFDRKFTMKIHVSGQINSSDCQHTGVKFNAILRYIDN